MAQAPLGRAIAVGEFTHWGQEFLDLLHRENILEIDSRALTNVMQADPSSGPTLLMVETGPHLEHWFSTLRQSGRTFYIVLFGQSVSKDEMRLALKYRAYGVLENPDVDDERVVRTLEKVCRSMEEEKSARLLIHAVKTNLLELEGDIASDLMTELKSAMEYLGQCPNKNEFSRGSEAPKTDEQDKVLFHQSENLEDIILTVEGLERTGVLWVKTEQGHEGRLDFLQGNLIGAQVGDVRGMKAILRMFLWDSPRFLFTRRNPDEVVVTEETVGRLDQIVAEGVRHKEQYEKIRAEVPPNELYLELDPEKMKPGVSMDRQTFLTLSSVVELGKVEQILDFNPLPDGSLYQSLIELRKSDLIRLRT